MTKYNDINSIEVEDFLNSWKDGVIDIGIAYPVSYTHLTLPTNREV